MSDTPKPKKKSKDFKLFNRVSNLEVALSIRHLSLMLKSGLSLGDAVQVLATQSSNSKLSDAYQGIRISIDSGNNLSASMAQYPKVFTGIIVQIVDAGEQGGTLEKNLEFLADYLKKANELQKKVKGALIYPGVVFGLTIFEMLGVVFFILPKLEDLFTSFENVPAFTLAILAGSKFVRENYIYAGIIVFIAFLLFSYFLKTKAGIIFKDWFSLHFPVIKKLNQNSILASFSRTLNILLETGLPLSKALEITQNTIGNIFYKRVLKKVNEEVKGGKNVAEALSQYEKFFPPTFVKMIEVGESTGSLEENLFYLYDFHSEEVDEMSSNLATLLEPILLIFIGAMIGGLALIIIGPIYQFTGSINAQ